MNKLEKEIKELEDRLIVLEDRIKSGFQERETLRLRKNDAESKIKSFDVAMEDLRKAKQTSLVLGENISDLNEKIKKLREEKDDRQDEVIGIEERISTITRCIGEWHPETLEINRQILVLKAVPIVEKYNEAAEKLSQTVTEVWKLVSTLAQNECPLNRAFTTSSWGGALICIPKLYVTAQPQNPNQEKEDFFKK